MRKVFILICATLIAMSTAAQEPLDTIHFTAVSWNVENLFDLTDDSLKNDQEFLPEGKRHWNYLRYKQKLNNIAKTIVAAGKWNLPALVALCEVENDSVLWDLTHYSALRQAGYRYVITESADERGIDVALLYQRHLFKLISQHNYRVPKPKPSSRPTRDILHVTGVLLNQDTLDVFVAHFPSRTSGVKETMPYRLNAANRIKTACDSLCAIRRNPQIIIMGDFNDYPKDKSIKEVLQAVAPPTDTCLTDSNSLYHLLARKAATRKNYGSYKYRGEWELIDHIIVSGALLNPNNLLYTNEEKADVFSAPFLLTTDQNYGNQQPNRTYLGTVYTGGYSDHLPLVVDFRLIY